MHFASIFSFFFSGRQSCMCNEINFWWYVLVRWLFYTAFKFGFLSRTLIKAVTPTKNHRTKNCLKWFYNNFHFHIIRSMICWLRVFSIYLQITSKSCQTFSSLLLSNINWKCLSVTKIWFVCHHIWNQYLISLPFWFKQTSIYKLIKSLSPRGNF